MILNIIISQVKSEIFYFTEAYYDQFTTKSSS